MKGVKFATKRGHEIVIEQVDGFGKNPSLWVRTPIDGNVRIKLASFGNETKAQFFIDYLTEFLGLEKEDA